MNTDQIRHKSLALIAIFEEVPLAEGGRYVAYGKELLGAVSKGNTIEEARENLRDAIAAILEIGS